MRVAVDDAGLGEWDGRFAFFWEGGGIGDDAATKAFELDGLVRTPLAHSGTADCHARIRRLCLLATNHNSSDLTRQTIQREQELWQMTAPVRDMAVPCHTTNSLLELINAAVRYVLNQRARRNVTKQILRRSQTKFCATEAA